MNAFLNIEQKLSYFYKKYYTNELIKGFILFSLFGVLYFILTLCIEYFFWLRPRYRIILLLAFIMIEFFLFLKFIISPISHLIKLKKGINKIESSKIIGAYFPEVQDKLLNVLQLKNEQKETDLILASIQQKSIELQPIKFSNAINFKKNFIYLKYLSFPILLWFMFFLTGIDTGLYNSLHRVTNPKTTYIPPALFSFHMETKNLTVIEGGSHTVSLSTKGDFTPKEVKILYGEESYFMQETAQGVFSFTFINVTEPLFFQCYSGSVFSKQYPLIPIRTPLIQNLDIDLDYPAYTKIKSEKITKSGNLNIPVGTKIKWNVVTHQSDSVAFTVKNQRDYFIKTTKNNFNHKRIATNSFDYQISSSNKELKDFEKISYRLKVIKDEYPSIITQSNKDSTSVENTQFMGQISDDYGINTLEIIYYKKDFPNQKNSLLLKTTKATTQTFFFQFPKEVQLIKGVDYELYFQVKDNDAYNGNKTTKSNTYSYRKKTNEEYLQDQLNDQKETINNLETTILNKTHQSQNFSKIQEEIKKKKGFNWNDKKKVDEFIRMQKQHQKMMERQTEKLQQSLEQNKGDKQTLQDKKQQLQNRIEELLALNKQKKLLDELQKIAEKFDKDELIKKTKALAQKNRQQEKSLERILELTKRFYVEEKTLQLANKLKTLSNRQDSINNNNARALSEQQKIADRFDKISKELKNLAKDNKQLTQPLQIPQMIEEKEEVKVSLLKAKEKLANNQKETAKKLQKKVSKQLQQMSQLMQKSIADFQQNSIDENIDDLRKILENLVTFSFKQEDLLVKFNTMSVGHPDFGNELKNQNELKTYFEHIDDSLFVLSMRLPQLTAKIQTELSGAHYNLDESLDNLSENKFDLAGSNQQYVMTSVNNLADVLSSLLNDMQNNMGSSGKKGKGKSFSLPTLIEKQKGLSEKIKEGLKRKKGSQNNKKGSEGSKGEGGEDEQSSGELFKLYQQQNELKQQLKEALGLMGSDYNKINKVLKTMEQLENDILEKGFNSETIQRMQQLEYQLLKLDNALLKQGKNKKRKSNSSSLITKENQLKEIQFKKRFYNQMEILNRQSLPLHKDFEKKVQKYFLKKSKD
jgi:hypothetical protein